MKLSASYNFFNGEEHLIQSIKSIRDEVDFISIVWQKYSNSGNIISDEALDVLEEINNLKLVDIMIEYHPDLTKANAINEREKRKIGLDLAIKNNCSHFFSIDSDEFYRGYELRNAKEYIEKNNINSTSVNSFFHLKSPHWRSIDTTCCAFITKINQDTQIGGENYPIDMVDPTRKIQISEELNHFHFHESWIAMYHMNFVRKDNLESKLSNTSTTNIKFLRKLKKNFDKWKPNDIFYFPNKGKFKMKKVENEFNTYCGDPIEPKRSLFDVVKKFFIKK